VGEAEFASSRLSAPSLAGLAIFSRVQKPDWLVGNNQTVGKAGFMLSGC